MDFVLILGGVIVFFVLIFVLIYNSLIQQRMRVDNAWSQIDVQLKKRFDLVPNLVETVKGYAKHEKELLTDITKARAAMANAGTMNEKAKADNMLSSTLKSLFAVVENYPQLKANENFLMLQEELSGIEEKIAYSRQFYNDSVLTYNTAIATIPTSIIAGMFGFAAKEFFKTEGEERKNVKVKF
ncbi:MAG: LemA family protein [Candidatus Micrarchaeota archaeon]|nr:LemA family protein [Candidatus Micrarchaeota archaeon]